MGDGGWRMGDGGLGGGGDRVGVEGCGSTYHNQSYSHLPFLKP